MIDRVSVVLKRTVVMTLTDVSTTERKSSSESRELCESSVDVISLWSLSWDTELVMLLMPLSVKP